MENQVNKNCIIDIYWERIFLNITFKLYEEAQQIYLVSGKEQYCIPLEKTEIQYQYHAKINITNIDGKMLENQNYRFRIKKGEVYEDLTIDYALAYRLESLGKICRYYRDIYAYTINFEVRKLDDEQLGCVLISRYMKLNKNPRKHCFSNKSTKSILKDTTFNFMANIMKILYQFFSFLHPNKSKKILLMSETRAPMSGNLLALDQRLKERNIDKDYKISYSFSTTLQESKWHIISKWFKLIWIMSKQEFIFVDDYSPIFKYIDISPKTKLIQVWHAGVGFKSVGYARFGFGGPEPYQSSHRKYDYAIVGEEALIPVYEEVFGITKEKILPYGLARMDHFFDKEKIGKIKENLYEKFPNLKEKKVILFAPTFRGRRQAKAYYPYDKLNLSKIHEVCKQKNAIFMIKMHPFIQEKIEIPKEYAEYIQDFSDYTDINDLYYIADVLVTDYSSSVYEYSKLKKPILLYTFDLDDYQLINRVHKNVREYEFATVCCTLEELLEQLKKLEMEAKETVGAENNKMASDLIIDNIILKGKE